MADLAGRIKAFLNRQPPAEVNYVLERRLQGPTNVATIDWIWDEYARITKGGRGYGERFRPTHSPDLEFAEPGCFGLHVR